MTLCVKKRHLVSAEPDGDCIQIHNLIMKKRKEEKVPWGSLAMISPGCSSEMVAGNPPKGRFYLLFTGQVIKHVRIVAEYLNCTGRTGSGAQNPGVSVIPVLHLQEIEGLPLG